MPVSLPASKPLFVDNCFFLIAITLISSKIKTKTLPVGLLPVRCISSGGLQITGTLSISESGTGDICTRRSTALDIFRCCADYVLYF